MGITGAVAMAASAYSQSVAMGEQAKQEELVAENNARMGRIRADQAIKQGEVDQAKFRQQAAQFKGTQKAAIAASGVVSNFGSAATIQDQTEMLFLEDEQRIKNNAALQAWGFKTESVNMELQGKYKAQALRNQATNTLIGGVAQAGTYAYSAGNKMKAPKDTTFSGGMTYTGSDYPSSSNVG